MFPPKGNCVWVFTQPCQRTSVRPFRDHCGAESDTMSLWNPVNLCPYGYEGTKSCFTFFSLIITFITRWISWFSEFVKRRQFLNGFLQSQIFFLHGNKWKQCIFNPCSFFGLGKKLLKVVLLIPLHWRCLGTLCIGQTGKHAPFMPVTKERERKGEKYCLPYIHRWTSRS